MSYLNLLESLYHAAPALSLYDGDEGIPTPPAPPTPPTGTGLTGDDPNAVVNVDPNARFDQTMVNKIVQDRLAKDRKKQEERYTTLEGTYSDLLANQALSADERTKLEDQLEDLQKQNRTKEEQAKHEKKQLQERYETELDQYKADAVRWEAQYKDFLVEKSLMEAAVSNDAFMPQQILSIVREWTKLVDAVDESGKPTGRLTPMVDLPDVDADTGKPIVTQRTPSEAIERLKELQPNLFKSNVVSGVGGNSTTGGVIPGADGRIDPRELTTDQWMKQYKDDPTKLGLRGRKKI